MTWRGKVLTHVGRRPWIIALCLAALFYDGMAVAQALQESRLGSIQLTGMNGGPFVVSADGLRFARRERIGSQERFVSLEGVQPLYDRLPPGATWVGDRLVYFAEKAGRTILVDGKREIKLVGKPTSPALAARLWVSPDRKKYVAFASDGRRVAWYADGKLQAPRFDRLALVNITSPDASVLFAAYDGCKLQLIGSPAFSATRWDMLHWVRANSAGDAVYAYGQQGGLPVLQLNGKTILNQKLAQFESSADGKSWLAVSDETIGSEQRISLWRNGVRIAEASADESRQTLYASSDGARWAWKILDEDYQGATIRQEGVADRRIVPDPVEYVRSSDGLNEGYVRFANGQGPSVEVFIDGKQASTAEGMSSRSLVVSPGGGWHYVEIRPSGSRVISNQGAGEEFVSIGRVISTPTGLPAYTAKRSDGSYLVLGMHVQKVLADNLHDATLAWRGSSLSITGDRGTDVISFTLTP